MTTKISTRPTVKQIETMLRLVRGISLSIHSIHDPNDQEEIEEFLAIREALRRGRGMRPRSYPPMEYIPDWDGEPVPIDAGPLTPDRELFEDRRNKFEKEVNFYNLKLLEAKIPLGDILLENSSELTPLQLLWDEILQLLMEKVNRTLDSVGEVPAWLEPEEEGEDQE